MLSLAAFDLCLSGPAREDSTDRQAIGWLQTLSEQAATQLLLLDTASDSDLQFPLAPKIADIDGPKDDLAQIGNAIGRLVVRLRKELDRLSRRKGPDARVSLPLLVASLCDLWERETGRAVSVNPYAKARYNGAPRSEAGVFVATAVAALAPTSSSLGALMKDSGRNSPPSPKSRLHGGRRRFIQPCGTT